jgi:hypothetical protein
MSGVVDLPLAMLQRAQHAAEAAAASAKLLESEAVHRLSSIETRLGGVEIRLIGVEGRLSALYAGQNGHTVTLMRMADVQSEHTVRLDAIDKRFDGIDKRFDGIERTLVNILARLS